VGRRSKTNNVCGVHEKRFEAFRRVLRSRKTGWGKTAGEGGRLSHRKEKHMAPSRLRKSEVKRSADQGRAALGKKRPGDALANLRFAIGE